MRARARREVDAAPGGLTRGICVIAAFAGCDGGFSGSPHLPADSGIASDSSDAAPLEAGGRLDAGASSDSGEAGSCGLTVPFKRLAVGTQWGCALRSDHTVECWGTPIAGEVNPINPPSANLMVSTVSSGGLWICGLSLADGVPTCWGDAVAGAPAASKFVDVSVGEVHACLLSECGDVSCWGGGPGLDTPPAGVRFSSIAVGSYFACGVASGSGAVRCWGVDDSGQSDPPQGSFVSVTTGKKHACAIATDATVRCWGAGGASGRSDGGSDGGTDVDFGQAIPPRGKFTMISAGDFHTCGIHPDGTVACWGAGTTNGGCGPALDCGQAMPPSGSFEEVRGAFTHTCGIQASGSIACWGSSTGGRSTPPADFH